MNNARILFLVLSYSNIKSHWEEKIYVFTAVL